MDEKEKIRVTLSIAFISIYVALIFSIPKILPYIKNNLDYNLNSIVYTIFVFFGILIALVFFLYLTFLALELNYSKNKEIFFIITAFPIKTSTISRIKKALFNLGVSMIFLSFSSPALFKSTFFIDKFGKYLGLAIFYFILFVSLLLLTLLFKSVKLLAIKIICLILKKNTVN